MSKIKIYRGDFREVVPKTISDNSIDMIITDPPYPKKYFYLWESLGKESARILKPTGNFISLVGHYQIPDVLEVMNKYLRFWWMLWMVQSKLNRLIGKGVTVKGKPGIWYLKERRRNFKEYKFPFDTLESNLSEDREAKNSHEWGQSVNWFQHYIQELTKPGEVVLDPFMGSGSVGIACIQTGRDFIGIEIDQKYYDIARERLINAKLRVQEKADELARGK